MFYLDFLKANCKNCYKCLRSCPVKAIDMRNNQAKIIEDRCILCGNCTRVCPQNAKAVHLGHNHVQNDDIRLQNVQLLQMGSVPIIRHTRVSANANPYLEPQYFVERKFNHGMKRLSGKFKQIWRNQHGRCYHCGLPMEISDEREIFYKIPKSMGGRDEVPNMAYVHKHCQSIFLERRAKA